jgi:hypothetical protein
VDVEFEFVVDDDDEDAAAPAEESSFRMRERLSGLLRLLVCTDSTACCRLPLTFAGTGIFKNTGCACGGARLSEGRGHSLLAFAAPAFRETLRRFRRFMS